MKTIPSINAAYDTLHLACYLLDVVEPYYVARKLNANNRIHREKEII